MYKGAGSILVLLAMAVLFTSFGTLSSPELKALLSDDRSVTGGNLRAVFSLFLFAFLVKLPVVPFHQWMAATHIAAHPAIVVIHSGILMKVATYGFVRFLIG